MACAATASSLRCGGIVAGSPPIVQSPPLQLQTHKVCFQSLYLPSLDQLKKINYNKVQGVTVPPNITCKSSSRVVMSADSNKETNVSKLAAVALLTAMVVPEMAEAVAPGVSSSLRNLLLSVVAGGVVLSVLGLAVAGVSTFDPVKRS